MLANLAIPFIQYGVKEGERVQNRNNQRAFREGEERRQEKADSQLREDYNVMSDRLSRDMYDQSLNQQMAVARSGGSAASQAASQNQALNTAPLTAQQARLSGAEGAHGYANMLGQSRLGQANLGLARRQQNWNEAQQDMDRHEKSMDTMFGAWGGGMSSMGSMMGGGGGGAAGAAGGAASMFSDERTKNFNRGVGRQWPAGSDVMSDERSKQLEQENAQLRQQLRSGGSRGNYSEPDSYRRGREQMDDFLGAAYGGNHLTPEQTAQTNRELDDIRRYHEDAGLLRRQDNGPGPGAQVFRMGGSEGNPNGLRYASRRAEDRSLPDTFVGSYDPISDAERRQMAQDQGLYSSRISGGGFRRGLGYDSSRPSDAQMRSYEDSLRRQVAEERRPRGGPVMADDGDDAPNLPSRAETKERIMREIKQAANTTTMEEAAAYSDWLKSQKAGPGKKRSGGGYPRVKGVDFGPIEIEEPDRNDRLPPPGERRRDAILAKLNEPATRERWKNEFATKGKASIFDSKTQALRDLDYQDQVAQLAEDGIAVSDEETKIAKSGDAGRAAEVFRKTPGYGYTYKDEFQGQPGTKPGPQYGIMAQDLEKTPEGAAVVEEDEEGLKHVDANRLTMLNSAAIHDILARLDKAEGRNRGRRLAAS